MSIALSQGLLESFCASSSINFLLAWLHSSCSMAHRPAELPQKLSSKPCDRAIDSLCNNQEERQLTFSFASSWAGLSTVTYRQHQRPTNGTTRKEMEAQMRVLLRIKKSRYCAFVLPKNRGGARWRKRRGGRAAAAATQVRDNLQNPRFIESTV